MRSYNLFEGGRALRIAVGITVLGLLLAGAADAATWTVDDSGGANFTRIQDAIDNAGAGDMILVYSGTYYENVNVNKQLILRGIGMPVVNANGSGSTITLAADGVRLEGFTATESGNNLGAGIKVTSNSNTLSGNNASNNDISGIELYSSSNNTLIGNNASNNYYGIFLSSSSNNTLINNNANSNSCGSLYLCSGIILSGSNNNKLAGNYASNNGFGISLSCSSNNIISGNNESNNSNGIYLGNFGLLICSSSNNTLSGNNASNNGDLGIFLDYSSNTNNLSGNTASNNPYGIRLFNSSNNMISGNTVSNNLGGIQLYFSSNNKIYNNIFNNTNNFDLVEFSDSNINKWNTTRQSNPNIIGGPFLGGNFWAYPNGSGFSQTCPDNNKDGLCDSTYLLNSDNIDYLPLSIYTATTPTVTNSISGFKINDANGNGKWDAGEKGISNWTIRLIGIIGKGKNATVIRNESLTDATGFYKFDNLSAGRYFVIEKLKKGFVATSSPVKRMKLAQGKNSMNNNFTNRPVHSRDEKNENRDIDDYENINRDIDKYKEDTNWG